MEKNLENKEALEKFKKMVMDIRTCMFITNTHGEDEHTRPMATMEVEDDGTLWFFTNLRSLKVEEIKKRKRSAPYICTTGERKLFGCLGHCFGNAGQATDER